MLCAPPPCGLAATTSPTTPPPPILHRLQSLAPLPSPQAPSQKLPWPGVRRAGARRGPLRHGTECRPRMSLLTHSAHASAWRGAAPPARAQWQHARTCPNNAPERASTPKHTHAIAQARTRKLAHVDEHRMQIVIGSSRHLARLAARTHTPRLECARRAVDTHTHAREQARKHARTHIGTHTRAHARGHEGTHASTGAHKPSRAHTPAAACARTRAGALTATFLC